MTKLLWDQSGERRFETGVDHGVLYLITAGLYDQGFVWNGLTTVTESPSGAEASPQYADNIKYLNLISAEEFTATIEAFTYPDEFGECDGTAQPEPGVYLGQQGRRPFGFSYRTLIGNDQDANAGYKINLVYGAQAAPSEKARTTVNDSPEATPFSWEVTTTPVAVGTIGGVDYRPTATLSSDSTVVDADALAALEDILYGTEGQDPRLPLPAEAIALFAGTVVSADPATPTFVAGTGVITIPVVTGVRYLRADTNAQVTGTVTIAGGSGSKLGIKAVPANGYDFPDNADDYWLFTKS